MIVRLTPEMFRDPSKSERTTIGFEPALFCDGLVCGLSTYPGFHPPHCHLVIAGGNPLASPRKYTVYSAELASMSTKRPWKIVADGRRYHQSEPRP